MNRSLVIDVLKIVAAQAIVMHHLSVYGPMADTLYEAWPAASDAFFNYSRLAVQVFLVMGGFLAAQAIRFDVPAPSPRQVGQMVWRRYARLIPPYLVALLLISVLVWLCRGHIEGEWLVASPTWASFLAHALTLQGLLGLPSMSAGVWYVAMDFQLFVLLALLVAAARSPRWLSAAVAVLCGASMLYFNRQEVALATAVVLALSTHWRTPANGLGQWIQRLADGSYGTFLTHYGVIVIMSAMWDITHRMGLGWAIALSVWAWLLSVGTGMAFHHGIEQPLSRRISALWQRARVTTHSATHTTPTNMTWPPHTHTPQTSPRLH